MSVSKPHWHELTVKQFKSFGNGCSYVPDFIFTASCTVHDFNYLRGYRPRDKLKADWDMCRLMWADSSKLWHYAITIIYYLGLTLLPFSYCFFHWGKRYRTLDEIIAADEAAKCGRVI